jgi:formylglycine-generating enzyme required for sulfatase activity
MSSRRPTASFGVFAHVLTRYRSHPLGRGVPPQWATAWGEDRHGVFAGFDVKGVEYRMRWIEGGEFVMGSPKREKGRFDDEVQHEVELSGFWLGEVPVTQALWEAVTGSNPSAFKTPDWPVDSVSWKDCEHFMRTLNESAPGLEVRFPTEAEWEYACRAGTTTATYVGDLKILGERHAPVLDPIAWYSGNRGRDFDLPEGLDPLGWPRKQYEDNIAGTRRVATKFPNGNGLYDMLGNVLEWCADWYDAYPHERVVNPKGPKRGGARVLRGGSWNSSARGVRAANRFANHPSFYKYDIGVRLARDSRELPAAERGTAESEPRASSRGSAARGRGARPGKRG